MKTPIRLLLLFLPFIASAQELLVYPSVSTSTAIDTIWGTPVADPYRHLEQESKARQDWLKTEKDLADSYIKSLHRKNEMDFDVRHTLYGYDIPYRSGPYYIDKYSNTIYYKSYLRDRNQFLFNAEMLSSGLKKISDVDFSKDGNYCAFAFSPEGNDWQEIRILNVNTEMLLKEHIYQVRNSNVVWLNNGFFYSRFDSLPHGHRHLDEGINQKICYHKIATDPAQDKVVFEDKDYPYNLSKIRVTEDGRFAIISEFFPEENRTLTFLKDYQKDESLPFRPLFSEVGTHTTIIGSRQDTLLAVSTNKGAYNGQIVEISPANPRQWGVVLDNQDNYRIKEATYREDKFVAIMEDAFQEYLCVFSPDGHLLKSHKLPAGSSSRITCYAPDQNSVVISTECYTDPPIAQLVSLKDYSLTAMKNTLADYNTSNYQFIITQYKSKDGTQIPIYIVMTAEHKKLGPGPAILHIYGAFDHSMEPDFSPGLFAFLNNGGIYAVANIRGGANAVKNWHQDGAVLHKQNSIDDTYYAARFLIDSGYAQSDKIAIAGYSHGALIAAATINQHPEAFRAAVLEAGLYDMVRYEDFSQGVYWTREYGSIIDSTQFSNLVSYSPLHNIRAGTNYPSLLIGASENDDRIPSGNSFKYVAALQQKTKSKNPIILVLDAQNNHSVLPHNVVFPFLFHELDIKYKTFSYYKDK
ncbi:MAG: S9 family peptidase [Bacteroidetes bacterium]|nr:S9 family peptidase [Bacteroidota bacterium]